MLPLSPLSVDLTRSALSNSAVPASNEPSEATALSEAELALKETAQSFEAAFIAQMLDFSGLAEAMTSGEGEMASAFSSFFLEALADDMAEAGAFGLADQLYNSLKDRQMEGGAQAPHSDGSTGGLL